MKPIALIGAPTDVGAGVIGTRMGPEALRVAGLQEALRTRGRSVLDCGDLRGPQFTAAEPSKQGLRHLDQVIQWNEMVFEAVYSTLQSERIPLLMGGDHSLAIGSISAVARYCHMNQKKLRILWLDAHADFNQLHSSPSGNVHGMPVACLAGIGPSALTGLAGFTPAVNLKDIRQIGVRSVDDLEKKLVQAHHLQVFDMRCIDEIGMRQTMKKALSGLDDNTHLHVSFDLDFLDPAIAPGVGTDVKGGPTWRESQLCMEMIADTHQLSSLDIVELNPARDVRNQTAELAVELIESLFGKSTLVSETFKK